MNRGPALVWFRRDLRLADNAALTSAINNCSSIIPVFIWDPEGEAPWNPGAASRWWLHQSLVALESSLAERGAKLTLRRGPTAESLLTIATESGAKSIFWNRCYEPAVIARDTKLKTMLREREIAVESFPGNLLFEPWSIKNTSGEPFKIFTAFWKACLTMPAPPTPLSAPRRIPVPERWPESLTLPDLGLEPQIDWASGLRRTWLPGESGAAKQLQIFFRSALQTYSVDRNRPDRPSTSHLSPHLHFGEISARQIWYEARSHLARNSVDEDSPDCQAYLRELVWREFAHHLLFHFPWMPGEPLRSEFCHFPWQVNERCLRAWERGKTGYPMVDAGMRQLWHTGWMHNRARMVVASFLVKHLLIDWRDGAKWFWDTLVDADLANNAMGWQWSAGCGVDAAPYFRIFNPVIQGEKFDPDGEYVRQWVPELTGLPNAWIHKPWKAPASVLAQAGIEIGNTYPAPIVIHEVARKRALMAFASIGQP